MVRSSDIIKKSSEEQGREKVDASSAFLRLSEIMQIKTSDETAARPPLPAIPATPVNPVAPTVSNIQQEAEESVAQEISSIQKKTAESLGRVIETERDAPPAAAFNDHEPDKAENLYAAAKSIMRDVKTAVVRNQSPEIAPALELVKKIVSQPALILNTHPLTLRIEADQDYYIFQPIHTMLYALKLGLHMSYTTQPLMELGLCCLLQNIGMFLIPDHIINKRGSLSAEEISEIRKHPETGRDLLMPFQADFPWLLKTVYQHHERENGQGYPLGIKGEEITEYAKIIGICDSYEAMTHSRPHRKAILQFDSVRQLIQSKERQFSPQILKVFLAELTIYPIGSYVRLNNAAIGRVIATNTSQPMRPVINLLIDGTGTRVAAEETIDLSKNNVLTILDVVPEEDIPH
jgi:HD-GYP domain-containing protein (c-di-GMP phosphodiesterase class II)